MCLAASLDGGMIGRAKQFCLAASPCSSSRARDQRLCLVASIGCAGSARHKHISPVTVKVRSSKLVFDQVSAME